MGFGSMLKGALGGAAKAMGGGGLVGGAIKGAMAGKASANRGPMNEAPMSTPEGGGKIASIGRALGAAGFGKKRSMKGRSFSGRR